MNNFFGWQVKDINEPLLWGEGRGRRGEGRGIWLNAVWVLCFSEAASMRNRQLHSEANMTGGRFISLKQTLSIQQWIKRGETRASLQLRYSPCLQHDVRQYIFSSCHMQQPGHSHEEFMQTRAYIPNKIVNLQYFCSSRCYTFTNPAVSPVLHFCCVVNQISKSFSNQNKVLTCSWRSCQ